MIKNLTVSSANSYKINKKNIHKIVSLLKNELNFTIFALEINFVDNEFILDLNKEYLDHHYYTDIITFNYSGDNVNLDGELFISVDEAKINSKRYDCTLEQELLRLVIHGILHIVGYDDMNAEDKAEMKEIENRLVKKYKYILEESNLIKS